MNTYELKEGLQSGVWPLLTFLHATAATLGDLLKRHAERRARRRLTRDTEQRLRCLDARALRDLGIARSEISSLGREAAGESEVTRQRIATPLRR